jgi:hypothetical protein
MSTETKVPEQTENAQIALFVSEYQSYARKSALTVLALAKTVLNARKTLSLDSDYALFRERVDLSDSAAKKICVVAEAAERIENLLVARSANVNANELATSTLYEIACLADAEYEAFVSSLSAAKAITASSVREFNETAKAKAAEKAKKDADKKTTPPVVQDKQVEASTADVTKADDKHVVIQRQIDVDTVVSAANASIAAVATNEVSSYAKCNVAKFAVTLEELNDEQKHKFVSRIKKLLDDFNLTNKAEFIEELASSNDEDLSLFADLEAA